MSVYHVSNALFIPIRSLGLSPIKAKHLCFEIALFVYKPCEIIEDHYKTIYQLIPVHIRKSHGIEIPSDITKIILDYLASISILQGPVQFDQCEYKEANEYLEFSNNNSMVRFRDPKIKYNHGILSNYTSNRHLTWVGNKDYMTVKSKYMINFEERVMINCYIKSLSDEMWIGFINKNKYNCYHSLKYNKHAISYNDGGAIYAFGKMEYIVNDEDDDNDTDDIIETQYYSGDWITFDILFTNNKQKCLMKIYKNGNFIVDCTKYLELYHDCLDEMAFCIEVDAPNDTVFVEQTLYWKQPMMKFDWISYYLSLKGNDFFCKIDEKFISHFCQNNSQCLQKQVGNYHHAQHQLIQSFV